MCNRCRYNPRYECLIHISKIVKVGTAEGGWTFDGEGCPNAVGMIVALGKPTLYGGYTSEELKEIEEVKHD